MKLKNKNSCCYQYKDKKFCADCGAKIVIISDNHCERCDGAGEYEEGFGYNKGMVTCEVCFGTGEVQKCQACGGDMSFLKKGVMVCQDCLKTYRIPVKI